MSDLGNAHFGEFFFRKIEQVFPRNIVLLELGRVLLKVVRF